MAKQLTVRGVSTELSRRLEQVSRAQGESLNTVVLRLLERAMGVSGRRERLKRYATWEAEDLQGFETSLHAQRSIDEQLWR